MATPRLLTGAPIVALLKSETGESAAIFRQQVGVPPALATLLVGEHPSALAYRQAIDRTMRQVGIEHRPVSLGADSTPIAFVEALRRLNTDPSVHGVLLLLPLPDQLSVHLAFEHLSPLKDVDGITPTNAGRLHLGLPALRPSTPQGGIELLDHYGLPIAGRDVVVVGRSNIVGRPLASLLTQRDATVTLCHRQTRDLGRYLRSADIVALAAGHPGLVSRPMLRPGAIVLDFGASVVDGRLVGDLDSASLAGSDIAYTPVPGGTGPVTTLVLARNVIAAAFASLSGSLDHLGRHLEPASSSSSL